MNSIGTRIRVRREYLGLSQTDLAERVNQNDRYEPIGKMHQSTVYKIELGQRKLNACEVPAFCEALDLTAEEMVGMREPNDRSVDLTWQRDAVLGRVVREMVSKAEAA